jgi:hypothetical protein
MPLSVVVQPGVADEVRVIEESPVGPQLVVAVGGAVLSVQVDRSDPDGAEQAAAFARDLVPAAMRFARCCEEEQDSADSASDALIDQDR